MPKSCKRDDAVVVPEEGLETRQPAATGWSGSRLGETHVAYLDLAAVVERRRHAGEPLSPVYRIYLRDRAGAVVAGHTIAMDSDAEAVNVAAILCHACKDVTVKFEIWKGEVLLATGDGGEARLANREELSRQTLQTVIDTEIALRDSRRALAVSRHLLDAIDEWQDDNQPAGRPYRRVQ